MDRAKPVEKTPEEKAKLLAESVALQRIDNAGQTALRTLQVILSNTAKEDPKYRTLRKDNGALQRKVASVPGAIQLMLVCSRCDLLCKWIDLAWSTVFKFHSIANGNGLGG